MWAMVLLSAADHGIIVFLFCLKKYEERKVLLAAKTRLSSFLVYGIRTVHLVLCVANMGANRRYSKWYWSHSLHEWTFMFLQQTRIIHWLHTKNSSYLIKYFPSRSPSQGRLVILVFLLLHRSMSGSCMRHQFIEAIERTGEFKETVLSGLK